MRLKELRLSRSLMQKDLSDFLGVERTTYVKYESGKSEPPIDNLIRLADFFGVSLDYLLEHETAGAVAPSPEESALIRAIRGNPPLKEIVYNAARLAGVQLEETAREA